MRIQVLLFYIFILSHSILAYSISYLNKHNCSECGNNSQSIHRSIRAVSPKKSLKVLKKGRCGISDEAGPLSFTAYRPWSNNKTYFTWKVVNGNTPPMGLGRVRAILYESFNDWAQYAPLTFREVLPYDKADIEIAFIHRYNDELRRFDGPGGVLAYAYGPPVGKLYFEIEEYWIEEYIHDGRGFNLRLVATHEIGHILGLGHSEDPSSIMYKEYHLIKPQDILPKDDRDGIQTMYGVRYPSNPYFPTSTHRITQTTTITPPNTTTKAWWEISPVTTRKAWWEISPVTTTNLWNKYTTKTTTTTTTKRTTTTTTTKRTTTTTTTTTKRTPATITYWWEKYTTKTTKTKQTPATTTYWWDNYTTRLSTRRTPITTKTTTTRSSTRQTSVTTTTRLFDKRTPVTTTTRTSTKRTPVTTTTRPFTKRIPVTNKGRTRPSKDDTKHVIIRVNVVPTASAKRTRKNSDDAVERVILTVDTVPIPKVKTPAIGKLSKFLTSKTSTTRIPINITFKTKSSLPMAKTTSNPLVKTKLTHKNSTLKAKVLNTLSTIKTTPKKTSKIVSNTSPRSSTHTYRG